MRRRGEQDKPEKGQPRPGSSVYESRFAAPPEDQDDGVEWTLLAEQDPVTGRWTRYGTWKPFGQTPLSEWKPWRGS
jgi:hypothetical protein